ncbi:MAG: hypothetical protein WED00_04345 [Aquisalimonadaceae bacterium]
MGRVKIFIAAVAMAVAQGAHADGGIPTIERFYADEENQSRFEVAQRMGHLRSARIGFTEQCEESNFDEFNGKLDCDCFTQEIERATDEEIYFESVLAYQLFVQRVEARRSGQDKHYKQLQRELGQRKGLFENSTQACEG